MKDNESYTVYGWMITKLGLTDNADLTLYAYIFGRTYYGGSTHGISARAKFDGLGLTPFQVKESIDRLIEKNLILYLGVGDKEIVYVNPEKLNF